MASTSTEKVELDPATRLKIDTAKQKKDTADQAFKDGELKEGEAKMSYIYAGINLRVVQLFDRTMR